MPEEVAVNLLAPPVARREPLAVELHGDRRVDDYFWLREKDDPAVRAYLEAENEYTAAMMKPTEHLQESLYQEMLARIKQSDLSVPARLGRFFYYSRTEEGKQYSIWCRRAGSEDGPEEVLLDGNVLAEGHDFLSLGAFEISDDGNLLAYSTDFTGFRDYTLQIKDLRNGALLPERIERVANAAWAADGRMLFYTVEDDAKRSYRLFRHRLGEPRDELLFEEADEHFRLTVDRSRSRAFLFLSSDSLTASEVRYLPSAAPEGDWLLVAARQPDHEYEADHHGDRFYIRSNRSGRNFSLFAAPVTDPRPENWVEVLPHRAEVMLTGMDFFAGHSVLYEREEGLPQIRVTDLRTGEDHRIAFPEPAYSAGPGDNYEYQTHLFRFNYESLVTPRSVFDYDMESRAGTLRKQTEVLGGYDPSRYVSERLVAHAEDGTRIPISIVYRRDRPRASNSSHSPAGPGQPLLLAGYGSYGHPLPVSFSSNRLSLLDRGFAVALAHIRGGGEMGKPWHDQGRMLQKRNTFTDFIAAAEHLVGAGYTTPDRLAIQGGSAGGLLIGAVLNMRPGLCHAAVMHVPFVDVLNSMLDSSLPLTVGEFEEWGDPRNPQEYACMRSYCPYTNLEPKDYPAILIRTALNDSQVMYWEPAKYTARLRTLKTDANPLLLKVNLAAGHGGASGRYDFLREIAFDYGFLLWQFGIPR
jgi:oligopeptidase B